MIHFETLYDRVPVWATDGAHRIQDRLLGAMLLDTSLGFYVFFPSEVHQIIIRKFMELGNDFLKLLDWADSEIVERLIGISSHWDHVVSSHEIEAMRRTVRHYRRCQQQAMKALARAAGAWKGTL